MRLSCRVISVIGSYLPPPHDVTVEMLTCVEQGHAISVHVLHPRLGFSGGIYAGSLPARSNTTLYFARSYRSPHLDLY